MKPSLHLSLIVGSVLTLAAGAANALSTAPTAGNTLDIGGATAQDRTIAESFLDLNSGVCANVSETNAAVSIDVYAAAASWTPASPTTYRIDCTVRSGTLAGTAISVTKYAGGSETGVSTVADGVATIGSNTVVSPNRSGCTGPVTVASDGNLIGYRLFTGCPTTATVPQVGVSDVEPKLFDISTLTINRLNPNGAAAVPMGIVVSRNFYRALQVAQGLSACADTVTAAGDDTEACMPTLTKQQVRALLSQNIFDTSAIQDGGAAIPQPSSGDTIVRICKRNDTSGTEQSAELLWFGEGCLGPTQLLVKMQDSSNVAANGSGLVWSAAAGAGNFDDIFVFPGRGSGDVESCLDWSDDNNVYAIGINSNDRSPNDTDKEFRYVKVDGYAPSVENVQRQRYPYYVENTVNSPTGSSPNSAAFNTGNRPTIFNAYLLAALKNPAVLGRSHAVRDWGRAGLLARPVVGVAVPTYPLNAAAPVNTSTRQVSILAGTPVDNCVEPIVVEGLGVIAD